VLYSYISTKDDGISATMMNLPSAAMLFIPLDSPHVSAELGAAPRPFDPLAWWLGVLVVILYIITFGIAYLIITIASSIADITNQNNQNAQSIGMTILSWLAHLAWLLVRAAILVLTYVLLALAIVSITVSFLTMIPFFLILTLCLGGTLNSGLFFIDANFFTHSLKMENKIIWKYESYFDLTLPYVEDTILLNNTLIQRKESPILLGSEEDDAEIEQDLINGFGSNSTQHTFDTESFETMGYMSYLFITGIPAVLLSASGYIFRTDSSKAWIAFLLVIAGIASGAAFSINAISTLIPLINGGAKDFNYLFAKFSDPSSAYLALGIILCLSGLLFSLAATKGAFKFTQIKIGLSKIPLLVIFEVILCIILAIISVWVSDEVIKKIATTIDILIGAMMPIVVLMTYFLYGKPQVENTGGKTKTPSIIKYILYAYSGMCFAFGIFTLITYIQYLVTGQIKIF